MENINKKELHEIFNKLKSDKKEPFDLLYSKYSKLVYAICFSILKNKENSEDVMQRVFLKIWKMEEKNLPSSNESSWLYRMTKNESLNYLRTNKNTINIEELYVVSCEDKEVNEMLDRDSYNKIIAGLNADEQEIISLKILSNLSFRQIAQILDKPIGTVQWKYYKSIHTLEILLSNLSMFIVAITSFIIGKTQNREKSSGMVEQNIQTEGNKINEEENKQIEQEGEDYDEYRGEQNNSTIGGNLQNKENNQIDYNKNDIMQNVVIEESMTRQKLDEVDIGLLSIAGITLLMTIIFSIIFIKHQQKANKKVSK